MKKYSIVFMMFVCFSLVLNAQAKKVKFSYNLGGKNYKGSVKILGVGETALDNRSKQVQFKLGGNWSLSCPQEAEYCGLLLVFTDLKLHNSEHEAKLYFSDYTNLPGIEVDSRGEAYTILSNKQVIVGFGLEQGTHRGQIPFKFKVEGKGEFASVRSLNNGSDIIFLQDYSRR